MKQAIIEEDYKALMESDCSEYRSCHFAANLEIVQIDMHYTVGNPIATVCIFDERAGADDGFVSGFRFDNIKEAMDFYHSEYERRMCGIDQFDF